MTTIEQMMTKAFAEKARQLHNDNVALRDQRDSLIEARDDALDTIAELREEIADLRQKIMLIEACTHANVPPSARFEWIREYCSAVLAAADAAEQRGAAK